MPRTRQATAAAPMRPPHGEMRARAPQAASLLRVMGNTQRLLVLCDLAEGERPVSALLATLPLSQSALSQHLAILREAGVVEVRRDGVQAFYRLAEGPARTLMAVLHDLFCKADAT